MPRIITRVIDQDDFYGVPGSGQVVIYDNVGNGILGFKTVNFVSGSGLGGFPVILNSPQENDILQLKSLEWKNTQQKELTDGGNF